MIEGTKVTIAGEEFTAAPLTFRSLEKYADFIGGLKNSFSMKDIAMVRGIITDSLRRNHPDLSDDFLLDNIDLVNAKVLLAAVLTASGGAQAEAGDTETGEA